jgi:menaquinone-dependent protoporphyrinogen oxidase
MKLLVAYATTDGMTARIAERIADSARTSGWQAEVIDTKAIPDHFQAGAYDAILLGASMHAQGYQRAAKRFVRRYREALRAHPCGFFSVCLSIASKNAEEREASRRIAERFGESLGWEPDAIEIIAGALTFSRYGFLRRTAMKYIARKEMGSVDATRDTVYTDWAAVDRFAREFVARAGEHSVKN